LIDDGYALELRDVIDGLSVDADSADSIGALALPGHSTPLTSGLELVGDGVDDLA
jgi:hypothetical protein